MQKKFSKILVGIFALVLLLPTIGLAGLRLEQNYPAISGITGQSESLNTAVSQTAKNAPTNIVSLVKYLLTLTIVILIGLATIALIIAGVQYLSSAGKVTAQKSARTRLIKAFIGLAIVVGASLILQIISPSLDIPELTHVYDSNSNIILISEEGLNGVGGLSTSDDITKEFLNKLADEGKIKYFSSQSADLTNQLGRLTTFSGRPGVFSFDDFDPKYLGFFGNGKDNISVKAFSDVNFLGKGYTYTAEGVMDNNDKDGRITKGITLSPLGSSPITYYSLPTDSYASEVYYWDIATNKAEKKLINHPPLSIMIQGIGAGVYLYGSDSRVTPGEDAPVQNSPGFGNVGSSNPYPLPTTNAPGNAPPSQPGLGKDYVGGKGGQRYLQFDVPNFADNSFDFDEQAAQIEIKNNRDKDKSVQDDLLVFLFEQPYYQGPFRAFFEEKKTLPRAKIYETLSGKNWTDKSDSIKEIMDLIIGVFKGTNSWVSDSLRVGNNEENKGLKEGLKIDVNSMDKQGKVFGVSSARVFHLAEFDQPNNKYKSTCQAVALCGAVSLQGYCLVFTPTGKSNGAWMSVFLPMPWFEPIAIPKELPKELQNAMLADPDQKKAFDKEKDFREFNDNIESIGIKGDCVVALYENSFKLTDANYWDSDTPGEKSMVFSKSDMVSGNIEGYGFLNLKNYQIHSCVSRASALRLTPPHSCVSAVAVYPVK